MAKREALKAFFDTRDTLFEKDGFCVSYMDSDPKNAWVIYDGNALLATIRQDNVVRVNRSVDGWEEVAWMAKARGMEVRIGDGGRKWIDGDLFNPQTLFCPAPLDPPVDFERNEALFTDYDPEAGF